ncbi:MAG: hypothetical protein LM588_02385 [Fervidicoccaceae archaeon]|nr:hypothetical protein [Fervidicoccaceae archaeon]
MSITKMGGHTTEPCRHPPPRCQETGGLVPQQRGIRMTLAIAKRNTVPPLLACRLAAGKLIGKPPEQQVLREAFRGVSVFHLTMAFEAWPPNYIFWSTRYINHLF